MKKNLQKTTKTAIIIIAMLLVSGQLVFGELKKSEIWNSDRIYYSFSGVSYMEVIAEPKINKFYAYLQKWVPNSLKDTVSYYTSAAPIDFYGYTIYGGYFGNTFTFYNLGKDKNYKDKNRDKYNKIYGRMALIYIPNVGYKVFIRIYDNHIKPATEFEDMVIGFVNTNNNTYICNTKTVKVSETDYDYIFRDYYSNRYIGEAVLDIPDNSNSTNNLGLYISNNYIQGKYIYFNVDKMLEISKSPYIRFKRAETALTRVLKENLFGYDVTIDYIKKEYQLNLTNDWQYKLYDKLTKAAKINYGDNIYLLNFYTYKNKNSASEEVVFTTNTDDLVYTEKDKFYIIVNGEKVYSKSFTGNPFFLYETYDWNYIRPFVYWDMVKYRLFFKRKI